MTWTWKDCFAFELGYNDYKEFLSFLKPLNDKDLLFNDIKTAKKNKIFMFRNNAFRIIKIRTKEKFKKEVLHELLKYFHLLIFKHVLDEIKYRPGTGVMYLKAQTDFLKYDSTL